MKRNINIITDQFQTKINGFDLVSVNNVNSVVDCSVDNVAYFCIEYMDKNIAKSTLDILMKKLRPRGSLVVKFCDLKQLCKDYCDNVMSNNDFVNKLKFIVNPLSIDEILTYVNINNAKITNISRDKNDIIVTITRMSL